MHDCPSCRVPLHGYEEVCPSCGAKQVVRRRAQTSSFRPETPGINWTPFVVCFVVLIIIGALAASSSWIGKVMTAGPPVVDPMEKMTYLEARGVIENELNTGLSALGATAKLTWQDAADSSPADKNADKNLTLTVDTALADPNSRKPIIDKVKDYMEKAKVVTLTMNDSKARAHWTYNMVAPISGTPSEE